MSVLVEGNKIAKAIPAPAGATVIDAKGKVLMPGLSDMHWHVMFNTPTMLVLLTADIAYLTLLGAQSARRPDADPDKNFVMIMKDGVIYKNTMR